MKLTTKQKNELEKIRMANGGLLTPAKVVKAASVKKSPLHSLFTWDDARAAQRYREDEAREIIRSVKIEYTIIEKRHPTPRYVERPDKDNGEAGYSSTDDLKENHALAVEALASELSRIYGNIRRAYSLAEELGVLDELEQLETEVMRIRKSITEQAA